MTSAAVEDRPVHSERPPRQWLRIVLALVVLGLVVMWVYAFVFAPRNGVNPVRDKAWTDGADAICKEASAQLRPLVFRVEIDNGNKGDKLPGFVANLDKGAVIIDNMLNRITDLPRTSEKAKVLVPKWLAEYRIWEKDLTMWIDELRAGKFAKFAVSITDTGIPINERINTFAAENHIKTCGTDLLTVG